MVATKLEKSMGMAYDSDNNLIAEFSTEELSKIEEEKRKQLDSFFEQIQTQFEKEETDRIEIFKKKLTELETK